MILPPCTTSNLISDIGISVNRIRKRLSSFASNNCLEFVLITGRHGLEAYGEGSMKQLVKLAIILSLILGIGTTGFAFENAGSTSANAAVEKPSRKKKKLRRSRRRAVNINPYAGRNRVIRVRRLSRRQVRDFYRRMLDIHLN